MAINFTDAYFGYRDGVLPLVRPDSGQVVTRMYDYISGWKSNKEGYGRLPVKITFVDEKLEGCTHSTFQERYGVLCVNDERTYVQLESGGGPWKYRLSAIQTYLGNWSFAPVNLKDTYDSWRYESRYWYEWVAYGTDGAPVEVTRAKGEILYSVRGSVLDGVIHLIEDYDLISGGVVNPWNDGAHRELWIDSKKGLTHMLDRAAGMEDINGSGPRWNGWIKRG